MHIRTALSCLGILVGAAIMLLSVVKSRRLLEYVPFVRGEARRQLARSLRMHRLFMIFFLLGYLIVAAELALGWDLLGEVFVSLIFLFGAIFVFAGIAIESQLLSEIQETIGGLLPICSVCKKVQEFGEDRDDEQAWKSIETYISERSDLTHGFCPECYEKTLKDIDSAKKSFKSGKS